ncbi:MAG: hypothetical protein COZ28_02915 [Candidatus Moranbacteria bacterium CG_4_10_14_3_um_filter_44_15]|nr:MAG: hypothetical protein COS72_02945 [Candidatus Moranbacteria bacterium CG06_land_8_20_14_3_00_43_56]PIV84157.1 MAG: hypothetical protein COW51_01420 [Candidatus Moranbacteria bacterium CG17_big_fil_post_rev_8_21_14_2_50_44_12]PIW92911.1 MAG: hypothetical protein COZ87_04205 [Candidatus Moranbacteria bacterium CG_4_8_14_3_um_filter_43_15]PIX90566.1 MAG: hypothetical protein COZ28_02915 [Candidatus Moranbacteria bacterium CG_4_10_14_3_um_filter_44_15]
MNLNNLISSLGIKSNLAGDMSFLILFLLVSFVVSFALGKHRLLVSLLGVYAAYAVVNMADFEFVRSANNKTLLFLAVLVGFVILFSRIIRANVSGHGPMLMTKLVVGTAIVVGLSLSIIFNWYSAKETADFVTPNIRKFFTGDLYQFLWGIAPLVYLGIVRKRID